MGETAYSRRSSFKSGTRLLLLATVLTGLTSDARAVDVAANQSKSSPAIDAKPVVCLHTEYYPTKQEALKFRLMRELGRQAVLIAARDELGLVTRDQTLDEVFPDSVVQAKRDVYVAVRSQYNGAVNIQL